MGVKAKSVDHTSFESESQLQKTIEWISIKELFFIYKFVGFYKGVLIDHHCLWEDWPFSRSSSLPFLLIYFNPTWKISSLYN